MKEPETTGGGVGISPALPSPQLGQSSGNSNSVMAGLDPAIHLFARRERRWMPGSGPGMTQRGRRQYRKNSMWRCYIFSYFLLTISLTGLSSLSSRLDERGERDRRGRGVGCGGRRRCGVTRCLGVTSACGRGVSAPVLPLAKRQLVLSRTDLPCITGRTTSSEESVRLQDDPRA